MNDRWSTIDRCKYFGYGNLVRRLGQYVSTRRPGSGCNYFGLGKPLKYLGKQLDGNAVLLGNDARPNSLSRWRMSQV